MSNTQQMFNAGHARGTGEEKASQCMDSLRDKASDASQKAEETKEEAAGLLQQTGEQMKEMAQGAKEMAQGAVDSVRNSLGMGDNSSTRK